MVEGSDSVPRVGHALGVYCSVVALGKERGHPKVAPKAGGRGGCLPGVAAEAHFHGDQRRLPSFPDECNALFKCSCEHLLTSSFLGG